MASTTFDEILLKGIRKGKVPARSKDARKWYRDQANKIVGIDEKSIFRESKDRLTTRFEYGKMYMFGYDPKHKSTLPYYDRFPLIFPVDNAKGGFYGINFHYLPLPLRAKLMDSLYSVATDRKYDEDTKLKLSYGVLKGAQKFKAFQPTFKHYLKDYLRTKFVEVYSSEWDIALFLPTADFQKASQQKVWADSRKIIRGS